MKRQATDWEKRYTNHVSKKGFVSRIYKHLFQFNNYTKNPRGGNGQMLWTDIQIFHQRDMHGKHKYFKRYSTLLVIVKVAQLCPILCNPMDYAVHGIQARIQEWVAFPFSRGSSQPRNWTQVSCIAGGFFTSWATREAQDSLSLLQQIFLTNSD